MEMGHSLGWIVNEEDLGALLPANNDIPLCPAFCFSGLIFACVLTVMKGCARRCKEAQKRTDNWKDIQGRLREETTFMQGKLIHSTTPLSTSLSAMDCRTTTVTAREPAQALPSSFNSSPKRQAVLASLICFGILQLACFSKTTGPERPFFGVSAAAARNILQRGASLPAARTERHAQPMRGARGITVVEALSTYEAATPQARQLQAYMPSEMISGNARERKLNAAVLKKGAPGAAVVIALLSGITTFLYGSPKQAYKRLRLKARRKVPWSWSLYMRSLPVIREAEFKDFPKRWPKDGHKLLVMLVKDVSPKLAKFLHLGPAEKKHGIAIKATVAGKGYDTAEVLNEINAHMNMVPRSKFILPVLGAYRAENGKRVYLILPRLRANARTMLEIQADTVNVPLALAEMAYSVKLMHDAGFLHRDIKLLNFFVGFDGHIVLADFEGTFDKSMWVDTDSDLMIYSKGYLAPEIRRDKEWVRFTERTDVYALGICFKFFLKHATRIPHKDELRRLVENMTTKDASKRYTMKQVLNHPFFKDISFDKLELLNQGVPFPQGDEPYEDNRKFL